MSPPAIFQQIIEQLLAGTDKVVVFLDDILITGRNTEKHLHRLTEVLPQLQFMGLRLKKKCAFLLDKMDYLGNQSGNGVYLQLKKM